MNGLCVGGFVPFSTVDFPGKLAAVVFCQGCPWRCGYCHNPHLLPFSNGDASGWDSVRAFLHKRRGLLDAVVFSGGEPTAQKALPDCAKEIREMGFAVGLHTGGAYPDCLERVLSRLEGTRPGDGGIQWVGLDIKGMWEDYPLITGRTGSGGKALRSLHLIQESGVAYECRTTMHPGKHTFDGILELARLLARLGVSHYSVQAFRPNGCADPSLPTFKQVAPSENWLQRMEGLFDNFTFRERPRV